MTDQEMKAKGHATTERNGQLQRLMGLDGQWSVSSRHGVQVHPATATWRLRRPC